VGGRIGIFTIKRTIKVSDTLRRFSMTCHYHALAVMFQHLGITEQMFDSYSHSHHTCVRTYIKRSVRYVSYIMIFSYSSDVTLTTFPFSERRSQ
jgi:hypothetical protein